STPDDLIHLRSRPPAAAADAWRARPTFPPRGLPVRPDRDRRDVRQPRFVGARAAADGKQWIACHSRSRPVPRQRARALFWARRRKARTDRLAFLVRYSCTRSP